MIAVDLHIHSGLSPCADNNMTPNNIINMARVKGLDAIAITDHNSTKNLKSFTEVAKKNNIICIPGVEVTTREEVHILAYFDQISKAAKFQEILDDTLPKIKNKTNIFGNQYVFDDEDNILYDYNTLLISGIKLNLKETIDEIIRIGGTPIPAHIDRNSYSILSNLGFIPPDLQIKTVEITQKCDFNALLKKYPILANYRRIINSDAHSLGDILERQFFIDMAGGDIRHILLNI
mgnify:CR=1 FL=1